MTPDEQAARKRRNWAIAGALLLFVALVFGITLLRLGANIAGAAS